MKGEEKGGKGSMKLCIPGSLRGDTAQPLAAFWAKLALAVTLKVPPTHRLIHWSVVVGGWVGAAGGSTVRL